MGKAGERHAAKIARETVLRYAPDFASDDVFLGPPDGTDKSEDEIKSWREAASFLLGRGFSDIDDRDDETDVIAECYLRIPDEVANVSSVSGVEKPRQLVVELKKQNAVAVDLRDRVDCTTATSAVTQDLQAIVDILVGFEQRF